MRKVGKDIGGCIYIHQSEYEVLSSLIPKIDDYLAISQQVIPHNRNVVKWNKKTGNITFVECSLFHSEHEPTTSQRVLISEDRKTVKVIEKEQDPWVFHHKWMMVSDESRVIDVEISKIRSRWLNSLNISRQNIGRKSAWEAALCAAASDDDLCSRVDHYFPERPFVDWWWVHCIIDALRVDDKLQSNIGSFMASESIIKTLMPYGVKLNKSLDRRDIEEFMKNFPKERCVNLTKWRTFEHDYVFSHEETAALFRLTFG